MQAAALILQALSTATAARLTAHEKQANVCFAREAAAAISANRLAAGMPLGRASGGDLPPLQSQLAVGAPRGIVLQGVQQLHAEGLGVGWGAGQQAQACAAASAASTLGWMPDAPPQRPGFSTLPASPSHAYAVPAADAPWATDDLRAQQTHHQQQGQLPAAPLEAWHAGDGRVGVASGDAAVPYSGSMTHGRRSLDMHGCAGAGAAGSTQALRASRSGVWGSDPGHGAAAAAAAAAAVCRSSASGSSVPAGAGTGQPRGGVKGDIDGRGDDADGGQEDWDAGSMRPPLGWGTAGAAAAAVHNRSSGSSSGDGVHGATGPAIYSCMHDLDLSQNPLGASGAKAVAQVRC